MIRASRAVTRPLIAAVVCGRPPPWDGRAPERHPRTGGRSRGPRDSADRRPLRRGRAPGLGAQGADGPVHGERAEQQREVGQVEEGEEEGPHAAEQRVPRAALGGVRRVPAHSARAARRAAALAALAATGAAAEAAADRPGCRSLHWLPHANGRRSPRRRPLAGWSPRGGGAARGGRACPPAAARTDCRPAGSPVRPAPARPRAEPEADEESGAPGRSRRLRGGVRRLRGGVRGRGLALPHQQSGPCGRREAEGGATASVRHVVNVFPISSCPSEGAGSTARWTARCPQTLPSGHAPVPWGPSGVPVSLLTVGRFVGFPVSGGAKHSYERTSTTL